MKIVKLLTLLIFISLQAGATGYSHNMFVAHKKLQAGKECRTVNNQVVLKKKSNVKANVSATPHHDGSITKQFANKLSGIVTLNQRILEEGPSFLFAAEEEQENDNTIVNKLVIAVKGMVYTFIGSSNLGKS